MMDIMSAGLSQILRLVKMKSFPFRFYTMSSFPFRFYTMSSFPFTSLTKNTTGNIFINAFSVDGV